MIAILMKSNKNLNLIEIELRLRIKISGHKKPQVKLRILQTIVQRGVVLIDFWIGWCE